MIRIEDCKKGMFIKRTFESGKEFIFEILRAGDKSITVAHKMNFETITFGSRHTSRNEVISKKELTKPMYELIQK